jgi:signal transduction histidine kinase
VKAAEPEIDARRDMNEHPESMKDVVPLLEEGTGKRLVDEIRREFGEFIEAETALTAERYRIASERTARARNLAAGLLVFAICAGVVVAVLFSHAIVRPLAELARCAEAVGKGDLETRTEVRSSDEIGVVAWAFNAMASNLREAAVTQEEAERKITDSDEELQEHVVQLEQAQKEAEAASRAKSDFLDNMSHEIRTPMTAILGYAELLRTEGDLSKAPLERIQAIDTLIRTGNHLLQIIGDILDLSKIEAAKMTVELIERSPWHVVQETVTSMRAGAESKGLSLNLEFASPLPRTIQTDPVRLKQILIDLIGNAVKFTERGGVHTTVRCMQQRGTEMPAIPGLVMEFVVTDTGIGMPKGQLDSAFQPFTQADTTSTGRL